MPLHQTVIQKQGYATAATVATVGAAKSAVPTARLCAGVQTRIAPPVIGDSSACFQFANSRHIQEPYLAGVGPWPLRQQTTWGQQQGTDLHIQSLKQFETENRTRGEMRVSSKLPFRHSHRPAH